MSSDRYQRRRRRFPFAGRWPRAALAPALAVGALALAAPVASPDPGGNGRGAANGNGAGLVPPGQAKKAAADAAVEQARAAAADMLAQAAASAADAVETAKPGARSAKSRKSRTAKTANGTKAAGSSSNGVKSGGGPSARASEKAQGTKSSEPEAGTAEPAAPGPTAAAAAVAPPPAAAATTPPATAPALAAVAPRASAGRTRMSDAAARRTAPARRSGPAALAPPLSDIVSSARTSQTFAEGGRATTSQPRDAERSPITRTVVRVLEVVPTVVWIALGALALLGLALAATTAVQTVRGRRIERQRRLLLDDVGLLQSALLPDLPERIGGAHVTAAYRPADGLAAGGDFFDAFDLPGGRTAIIVGDIAGHGRDAIPLTALVRYNLRAYLEAGLSPRATLNIASNVLTPQLGGRQVTIVAAIFDPGTGRLTYACAGHWPPLLVGTADAEPITVCSSPPVAAGAPTGRRQTTIALAPGARACFHTDGLGEVPVGRGRRLGREGVVAEFEAIGPHGTAADLVERIVRRGDHQPDDMAACILTVLPGAAEHWPLRIEELEVDAFSLRNGWAERFLVACGVSSAHVVKALRDAHQMIDLAGTAILEVRIGEELVEVRVGQPPAVMLPIARRAAESIDLAATA